MDKQTYYITEIKTIFFKDSVSECHGDFVFNGHVELDVTLDELKEYCNKTARINSEYDGEIVLTVYYFDHEDGLEDYEHSMKEKYEYNDDDMHIDSPSEKSWIINKQ